MVVVVVVTTRGVWGREGRCIRDASFSCTTGVLHDALADQLMMLV